MSAVCFAFQRGTCNRGSECRFTHEGGGGNINRIMNINIISLSFYRYGFR